MHDPRIPYRIAWRVVIHDVLFWTAIVAAIALLGWASWFFGSVGATV